MHGVSPARVWRPRVASWQQSRDEQSRLTPLLTYLKRYSCVSIEIVLHVIMCLGSCTPPWHPGADPCEMSDVGPRELLGGVARRSGCGLSEGDTGLTGVADAVRHGSGRAAAGPRSRV